MNEPHHSLVRFLTREQSRSLDRRAIDEFGMSGLALMENAGRNMAELLLALASSGDGETLPPKLTGELRVTICCGKGNNAGDGFVIARHLDNQGVKVRVLCFSRESELAGDALANFKIGARSGLAMEDASRWSLVEMTARLADADWIVDALLGTGAQGDPRAPIADAIRAINASSAAKLAVDLPSGLDADTGSPSEPTVRAMHTATCVLPKVGFQAPTAKPYLGEVHTIDIGAPRRILLEIGPA